MPLKSKIACAAGLSALALAATASAAWAWGSTGHRLVGRVGMESLPVEIPAFLRTPEAIEGFGELAREPDRSKGAGQPHDADLDPGHFVDLTEDGHIFAAAGPSLAALPRSRADYDVALAKAGIDPFKAGYLEYNLMDGYEQLVKDFAYWRIETALLKHNGLSAHRAWIQADLRRREALTIRDLGYWAHFVGDGSQPMHVSIHYNGWGDYPNPENFTQDKIHGPFEGAFVFNHVSEADVKRALPAPADCGATIKECTTAYLTRSQDKVVPLYRLYNEGAFTGVGTAAGKAFAVERVAAGAAMLRDLVVKAWVESGHSGIGRPVTHVADVEADRDFDAGKLWAELYGDD